MIALMGNVVLFGIHVPKSLKNYFLYVCSALCQRRQWQPTLVLLPKNPMDGGAW